MPGARQSRSLLSRAGLHGRENEFAAVSRALRDPGVSVIWISGPPGSGRTAMLRRSEASSPGLLARASRQESEAKLSGVMSLTRPDSAAKPTEELSAARALVEALPPGHAVVLIDDAQWWDGASRRVLRAAMARHRLTAIATTDGTERWDAADDVLVELTPLPARAAQQIIAERNPLLSPGEIERAVREAEGNALALVELAQPHALDQLDPRTPNLEASYGWRIAAMTEASQRALMTIAVADWRRAGVDEHMLRDAGVTAGHIAAAERALAVHRADGCVLFTHGAARREALRRASFAERSAAARLLAASSPDEVDRAWHAANATTTNDSELARRLEAIAGGIVRQEPATAAKLLTRAVEKDYQQAGRRLVLAAEAWMEAGETAAVPLLLQDAQGYTLSADVAGRAALVEGVRALREDAPSSARRSLVVAAASFPPAHPKRVRALHILAETALWMARPDWATDMRPLVAKAEPGGRFLADVESFLVGGGRARPTGGDARDDADDGIVASAARAMMRADDAGVARLMPIINSVAPRSLTARVMRSLVSWHGASLPIDDLSADGAAWDVALDLAATAHRAADRGDADACRESAEDAIRLAVTADFPVAGASAQWALARVTLQHGEPEVVLNLLKVVMATRSDLAHPVIARLAAGDLLEAAARAGDTGRYADVRTRFSDPAVPGSQGEIVLFRTAGMLSSGAEADHLFARSIRAAAASKRELEEARSHLAFGEHLRRSRQRVRARDELRAAEAGFEAVGAAGWLARTRREIEATGETVHRKLNDQVLTPRERQIVELVIGGASNQEIAARLSISRKTVETHLHNVYLRLGVPARRGLAEALSRHPVPQDDGR